MDFFFLFLFGAGLLIVLVSLGLDAIVRKIFKRKPFKEDRRVFISILVLLAVISCVLLLPVILHYDHRDRTAVATARVVLSQSSEDLENYRKTNGKYSGDAIHSRYLECSKNLVKIYISKESIPKDLISLLQDEEIPFIAEDKYRLMSLVPGKGDKAYVFIKYSEQGEYDFESRLIEYKVPVDIRECK